MNKKAFVLFLLFIGWAIDSNGQITGYILECNGQKVAFGTVLGLDGTTQTSVIRSRTLTSTNPLSTSALKTITLQKLRCTADNELYKWFCSFNQASRQKQDVRIKLINLRGETIKAWRIYQASPANMAVPPPLNADANTITIESVVLTYEKIEPDW